MEISLEFFTVSSVEIDKSLNNTNMKGFIASTMCCANNIVDTFLQEMWSRWYERQGHIRCTASY